jgi:ATP-dependent helicase/DNAse subunit B
VAIYISASLLEDFMSCNRKVFYRTNKPETSISSDEMIVGEVVHSAIEKYWNNEVFSQGYAFGEIKERLPNSQSAISYASTCLHNYHQHFQKYLDYEDEVEYKFKIQWDKDVYIVGKMDRISKDKIFDWKTARNPPTNISSSIQFILYNWAFKKIFNRVPSGVYYAALKDGTLVSYSNNLSASHTLFNEIIPQTISAMRNKDYVRNGVFRRTCYSCPYKIECLKEFNDVMDSATPTTK